MKKILVIIRHRDIGGADKRILSILLQLFKLGYWNIHILLNKHLYDRLPLYSEIAEILNYDENLHIYQDDINSFKTYRQNVKKFIAQIQPETIHYILAHPLLPPTQKYKVYYTYPMTNLGQLNWKGRSAVLTAMLLSNRIDILNPALYKKLRKLLWFKKSQIFLTPGSFVDLNKYPTGHFSERKNNIVFLGRFEFMKQPIEFLEQMKLAIPKIVAAGFDDVEIHMVGRGTLKKEVEAYLNCTIFKNKLKVYETSHPQEILQKSKVFFSVQKYSNYPSKSLLEAIACGTIPIVTNNDDVEYITHPDFTYLINEKLDHNEFVPNILEILNLNQKTYDGKVNSGRNFIEKNFSLDNNVKYFKDFLEL